MTRSEVLRALADGKEAQHLRCGVWRVELSADDYAALLPAAFSPELWRLAPSPVPPGDLTYEEAERLHKEGIRLQIAATPNGRWLDYPCGNWEGWFTGSEAQRTDFAYRRKPAPRPVPPGDLTWEQAGLLLDDNIGVQLWGSAGWVDVCKGDVLDRTCAYRCKPAPKMVPWGPEDVPAVCWVHFEELIDTHQSSLVLFVNRHGVQVEGSVNIDWNSLTRYSYSTDRRTWKPCAKEAT